MTFSIGGQGTELMSEDSGLPVAVRGVPEPGTWDPIFTLFTVDDDGFPHPFLLSRASLDATGNTLRVVLASASRTVGYLRRRPRAALVFIDGEISYSCECEASGFRDTGRGLTGVAMTVLAVRQDTLGIPLRPASFWVTEAIAAREAWARSAALLAEMAADAASPGPAGSGSPGV
jgi:hypothetical protein